MSSLAVFAVVWVVVALILCERNRRRNPLEHGAENAIAWLWPITAPFTLLMILGELREAAIPQDTVRPYAANECGLCGGFLNGGSPNQCSSCGGVRTKAGEFVAASIAQKEAP